MVGMEVGREVMTANKALARLVYLAFALPTPVHRNRTLRQVLSVVRQYPRRECGFEYRKYAYLVEKETRKVRAWYLNGEMGPRTVGDLSVEITSVPST